MAADLRLLKTSLRAQKVAGADLLRQRGLDHRHLYEDIAARLAEVTWRPDGAVHLWDAISYPAAVWRSKRDDCDGFAVLAAALLQRWDASTDPVLLSVVLRPLRRSHTVCVFRHGGALRFFDNARLRPEPYATYADVAVAVAQRGRTLLCWDVASADPLRARETHLAR